MKNQKSIKAIPKAIAIFLIACGVALTASIFIWFLSVFLTPSSDLKSPRMFENIDDLSKLDQYAVSDLSFDDDKNLQGSVPISFYIKKIKYEGHTYSVYAYVFTDVESAKSYFEIYTGKTAEENQNFLLSSGLFHSSYIVFEENRLYRIEGGLYRPFVAAVRFICQSFS